MDPGTALADAILSMSADAIVAADREGIIRFWNPGAERIFGYRATDAVGQSLDLIIPERLRARHWQGYRAVMESGVSRYGEGAVLAVPSLRQDGRRISIEFTIVPLKNEQGRMEGMAAIIRDVTERFEELQSLKKKLAAMTEQLRGGGPSSSPEGDAGNPRPSLLPQAL